MNKANNVIDLKSRLARNQNTWETPKSSVGAPVLDMTTRRQEMLTHERRKVRRTILSEFIGAFIVIPGQGLQRVSIYDISEDGLAFDLDSEFGSFKAGEEVAMRVYLNNQTYFPFIATVANTREVPEEGVSRHGCGFVKGTMNDEALYHFVRFIETVSASLKTDGGDVMVSNLTSR
jgi:hypothetical protein